MLQATKISLVSSKCNKAVARKRTEVALLAIALPKEAHVN